MNIDLLARLEEKTKEFKKLYVDFCEIKENLNDESHDQLTEIKEKMAEIQREIAELKEMMSKDG